MQALVGQPFRINSHLGMMLLLMLLTGCGRETAGLSVSPSDMQQWRWNPQHTYSLLAAMALESEAVMLQNQVPADIVSYCRGYTSLDPSQRTQFWVDLLATMSFYESQHDPDLTYQERFNDNSGAPVISRGLLQLSYESSQNYDCPLENEAQLHLPAKNIDGAVRILNKWVVEDGVISEQAGWLSREWRGGARYWAVLRRPETLVAIQQQLQQQPYC